MNIHVSDISPSEFRELLAMWQAGTDLNSITLLNEKVNAMSEQVQQLETKVGQLEAALNEQVTQSAALRSTVTQLVSTANELKEDLDAAIANAGSLSTEDAERLSAVSSKVDALIAAATTDTQADAALNQTAADAVVVDNPAN